MKTTFLLLTQPKSCALPVKWILKPVAEVSSPLAGCSTDGHCPHYLGTPDPAFKLRASALELGSPSTPFQGHPHLLLWLVSHIQSVLALLSRPGLWGQAPPLRPPHRALLRVLSISHLHTLLQPPYSLTAPGSVPCCCQAPS